MSVESELLMNTQNSFQTHAQRGANIVMRGGKRKSKHDKRMRRKTRKQRGGQGRTITYSNLDFMANNRLGKMVPHGDVYTGCANQQSGGASYGFTNSGAEDAATFRNSYPAITKHEKSNQCGGKRRRRKKSRKSRRKSRKSRRKKGGRKKSRRKSKSRRKRKSRRRRRRRRGGCAPHERDGQGRCPEDEMEGGQRGGSTVSYSSPFAGGEKPWATAPLGIQKNGSSCYDNYNHYKGL